MSKIKIDPPLHIVKRPPMSIKNSLLIRLAAILSALVLISIITLVILKQNPIIAFATMFKGVFGTNTATTLRDTAILLCIALALTPAFKMKFWNIGAEGQVLVGALATAFCMYNFYSLPAPFLIVVMFFASMLMGAIWAVLPAIFKAFFGTNETLFTLMMNSIASFLTLFCMKFWATTSNSVGAEILDPERKINSLIGNRFWLILLIVLIIDVLMFVYLKYAKQGYEISVVGESEKTAKYVGISVRKVIIRTLVISGIICGIAGFLIAAPAQNISNNIVNGRGFTAIMVAWLAKFNPLIMILSAFLFIFVSSGGREISTALKFEAAYADILIGVLLFFIIGCEFFITYKLIPATYIKNFFNSLEDAIKKLFTKSEDKQ